MDFHLAGRRALVTASSGGIGEAIARALAAEGADVAINGRREGPAEKVVAEINAAGRGRAALAVGDLTSEAGIEAVAAKVRAAFGEIDILVNNMGGASDTAYSRVPWVEAPPQVWMDTYFKNVVSPVLLIRRFVPAMRAQGWGRVINLSSAAAVQPLAMLAHYSAAKAAVLNMTLSLAKAMAQTGVTVNAITPGSILTNLQKQWMLKQADELGLPHDLDLMEKRRVSQGGDAPLTTRIGRPAQIGALAALLCGASGDFINGANYRVDGGQIKTI